MRCRRLTRLMASTLDTAPIDLRNAEGVDADIYQKCLQAAVDLQERGWTIVEDVFSQ